jgi:hypothetical protein
MSNPRNAGCPALRSCLIFSVVIADGSRNGGARRDRTDDLMLAKHALSQLSYGPVDRARREVVGLGRLELPTSRLSSARSNQLSYKPDEASSSGLQPNGAKPRRKKGRETKAAARRHLFIGDVWGKSRERSRKHQSLERR